ncbi:hypothetical protein [Paenibacillus elgii]|uniref:hypothetical protein n=1 Tax=Paenibacillus elgii TaxID=189691 RepID=UPI00203F4E7C|nr:hypothetical protein [Paenibacillus elgii]MCM3272619.1 hypothetical protein [Paenibacillus elgii]
METEKQVQSKTIIKYAPDHKRFMCSGALSFINSYGELSLDLYEDVEDHNKVITSYVGEENVEIMPADTQYIRTIHSTMVITYDRIPELIEDLQKRYDLYKDFRKGTGV